MESVEKRNWPRHFTNDVVGIAQYATFYLAEMRYQLRCGPCVCARGNVPSGGWKGISRAKESFLGTTQLFNGKFEIRHGQIFENVNSEGGAACLFKGVGELQNTRLTESRTEKLQPNGQIFWRAAARNRDARNACEGSGDRVDVSEVHLERIARAFAQFECGNGRGWRDDGVHFCERVAKILRD